MKWHAAEALIDPALIKRMPRQTMIFFADSQTVGQHKFR